MENIILELIETITECEIMLNVIVTLGVLYIILNLTEIVVGWIGERKIMKEAEEVNNETLE